MIRFSLSTCSLLCTLVLSVPSLYAHQAGGPHHHSKTQQQRPSRGPVRMTMDALHRHGGVPPGWTFTLPAGDPQAGREVFIEMKCYTCHNVAGETFPAHKRDIGDVGPDLTGMGAHHPAEYFAETIINPNAVIIIGKGYTGPDGLSRMPEYNDILTIRQLIDLVAYLKSLRKVPAQAGTMQHHHGSHRKGHLLPGMLGMPSEEGKK